MLGWLYEVAQWIAGKVGEWLAWMLDGIVTALNEFLGWLTWTLGLLLNFVGELVSMAFNAIAQWLGDTFQAVVAGAQDLATQYGLDFDTAAFQEAFTTLGTLYEGLNYLLPVTQILSIVAATYTLILLITVVRWIIGFIPTIEG